MAASNAYKDNDRVFKNIENMANSTSKPSHKKIRQTEDRDTLKRYYEGQIDRLNTQHHSEITVLREEIGRMKVMMEERATQLKRQECELRECCEEKDRLEQEMLMTTEKFTDTVSEIEQAK